MCKKRGIEVVGVTKGVSGMSQIAKAMLEEGVSCLADARIRNIEKMKKAGIESPIMLLRLPRISYVGSIVRNTDISLNSEPSAVRSLAQESRRTGKTHGIILMVDVGDLREGFMYDQSMSGLQSIFCLKNIDLRGIGTNVGCFGGVLPTEENMGFLVETARKIQKQFSVTFPVISIGGTSCLSLVKSGKMPPEVNQIRIGEGILLGRDSSRNTILENTYQDTFTLAAEIVEIKKKPSLPIGPLGRDAFGNVPSFNNYGVRRRALIALGKQDIRLSGLIPVDKGIRLLGGSSDYIVLDISDSGQDYAVGDEVYFHLLYPSLLSATTTTFVNYFFREDSYGL